MTTGPDERLLDYMRLRQKEHKREAGEMFAALTERERLLVRQAAVMGFVQGSMAAGGLSRENFPGDHEILEHVLTACRDLRDLYPTIAALGE